MSRSTDQYVADVTRLLSVDTELLRENPVLLLGSGRTLDSLPPPPTKQQIWKREHRDHPQGFMTFGRDEFGPIDYWTCIRCFKPEPDCVNRLGDWASHRPRESAEVPDAEK